MAKKDRDFFIKKIEEARKALEDANTEYREFMKENPGQVQKQATLEEIRQMRMKAEKSRPKDEVDGEAAKLNQLATQDAIQQTKSNAQQKK